MGWTPNRFPGYRYCRAWEARLPDVTEREERNALMLELLRSGRSMSQATSKVGVTRQRGQQIVKARTAENYDPAV